MAGWLRETLVRDVLVAVIVGLLVGLVSGHLVASSQAEIDDARAERELTAARDLANQATRLENLRFVRDSSSEDAANRQFSSLDLSGMTLGSLNLRGADFTEAILDGTQISRADATNASFYLASMTNAGGFRTSFVGAQFDHATLDDAGFAADFTDASMKYISAVGADFKGSNFDSADLSGADLRGTNLYETTLVEEAVEGACHDDDTEWPEGFNPPPSAALSDCGPRLIVVDLAAPLVVQP